MHSPFIFKVHVLQAFYGSFNFLNWIFYYFSVGPTSEQKEDRSTYLVEKQDVWRGNNSQIWKTK